MIAFLALKTLESSPSVGSGISGVLLRGVDVSANIDIRRLGHLRSRGRFYGSILDVEICRRAIFPLLALNSLLSLRALDTLDTLSALFTGIAGYDNPWSGLSIAIAVCNGVTHPNISTFRPLRCIRRPSGSRFNGSGTRLSVLGLNIHSSFVRRFLRLVGGCRCVGSRVLSILSILGSSLSLATESRRCVQGRIDTGVERLQIRALLTGESRVFGAKLVGRL